jgi:hypothetical protein
VVVRESGKYYLVRRDMLAGALDEATAGKVARRFGTPLKSTRGIDLDSKKSLRSRFPVGVDEWRIGEATFNKNLEMVGAGLRSPVALVICQSNADHIYVANTYETCPRDGGKLVRLERS